MKIFLIAAAGALFGAAGSSQAQGADRHFYAGIDLGQAELNRNWPHSYFGPRRDRESTAWKLRFGYQFTPHFAIEAAYTDFGDYDGSAMVILLPGQPASPIVHAPGDYRTSSKGMEASAVGTWPIGETMAARCSWPSSIPAKAAACSSPPATGPMAMACPPGRRWWPSSARTAGPFDRDRGQTVKPFSRDSIRLS